MGTTPAPGVAGRAPRPASGALAAPKLPLRPSTRSFPGGRAPEPNKNGANPSPRREINNES